jgi:hypothetical protein
MLTFQLKRWLSYYKMCYREGCSNNALMVETKFVTV